MKPTKTDDDALVDLLDVVLEKGVVLQADVIISVADIPLVGVQLRAALAGMDTMTEYGLFEEWDARHRSAARSDEESTAFVGRPGDGRPERSALEDGRSTGRPGDGYPEDGRPADRRDGVDRPGEESVEDVGPDAGPERGDGT